MVNSVNKHQRALAEELKGKYFFDRKAKRVFQVDIVSNMEPTGSGAVFTVITVPEGQLATALALEVRASAPERTFSATPAEALLQEYGDRLQELGEARADLERVQTRLRVCEEKEQAAWAQLQTELDKEKACKSP